MYNFITQLIRNNSELLRDDSVSSNSDSVELQSALTTLAIAQASLRRIDLYEQNVDYPRQVVITGPTQVGKSAMVNLLLQQQLADSNATAGYTVHCQGFHAVSSKTDRYQTDQHWATQYFGDDLQLSAQGALDPLVLGEYSLQETVVQSAGFQDTVLWDTPDFDSIRSFEYRAPLVKAVALADLVVFVVSKEKYADQTVWLILEMLASRAIPVVVVMNKVPVGVRAELKASFEGKYRIALPELDLPEIGFVDEFPQGFDLMETAASAELDQLRELVQSRIQRVELAQLKNDTTNYLKHNWDSWTAGISSEHRLQRDYQNLVDRVCEDTLQRYRTEYIDSDRHREVIQMALSELLVLLEVPGMAKPLGKIRNLVTWPVRTILSTAKDPSPVANDDRNEERRLLDELGKHAIASLSASISRLETNEDWWREVRAELDQASPDISAKYHQGLDNYHTLLKVEIDRAAQSLYQNLQQQPATLNSLRAARVTADAAAVVLAVKSGGLGAVDLVVAPAMLSLTTLLTEGALGKYMKRIQKKLTAYQEKEVRSVIERRLARPLHALVKSPSNDFITEDQLQTMSQKLEAGDV